jgi:hypothetical protein
VEAEAGVHSCWGDVHISSLFTIREQRIVGSAGLIAGPSTHLIPERKRLTGFEGAKSAGGFADLSPRPVLTVFLKWPIFLNGKSVDLGNFPKSPLFPD